MFFTILGKTGLFSNVPGFEFWSSIISMSIFCGYNLCEIYLQIYFMKVGFFIIRLLKSPNKSAIQGMMVLLYLLTIFAWVMSILWWIYPTVKALTGEECSDAFISFRPYMIYFFHLQFFVEINCILFKLRLVSQNNKPEEQLPTQFDT